MHFCALKKTVDVIIFESSLQLRNHLDKLRLQSLDIAFVPTMGALHEGHLSLIKTAKSSASVTVCSIFVNPTQFNDPSDLQKYPRPIERDIALLKKAGCTILFLPTVEEMYPADEKKSWSIDLEALDHIWEGEHRPGHFQGVTQIVHKLFSLVEPDAAIFGQKDYQQVMVIQKMLKIKKLPVRLVTVPTRREENGLALSSRNERLSAEGRQRAGVIYQSLCWIKDHLTTKSFADLEREAILRISDEEGFTIEYLAICAAETLKKKTEHHPTEKYVVITAVWLEGIRLIDNMILN